MLKRTTWSLPHISLLTNTKRTLYGMPVLGYPIEKGCAKLLTPRLLDYHYNKHHRVILEKLNRLIEGTRFQGQPIDQVIKETELSDVSAAIHYYANEHFNHCFYWKSISPNPHKPYGTLKNYLNNDLRSYDVLKKEFMSKATSHFGSGWIWLVLFQHDYLEFRTYSNSENPLTDDCIPLMACDLWEHAYYLDYQNNRQKYLERFWDSIDWGFVNANLEESIKQSAVRLGGETMEQLHPRFTVNRDAPFEVTQKLQNIRIAKGVVTNKVYFDKSVQERIDRGEKFSYRDQDEFESADSDDEDYDEEFEKKL
ncbi:superoxide dismutase, Fe-Mn [Acrasis kona]|uniref:superoxide dismutase n=1 Tax=Acrasis kona TaxID=1008807 RepID=A0AAW2ZFW7_9EUKA